MKPAILYVYGEVNAMPIREVRLTEALDRFIEAQVATGMYEERAMWCEMRCERWSRKSRITRQSWRH